MGKTVYVGVRSRVGRTFTELEVDGDVNEVIGLDCELYQRG